MPPGDVPAFCLIWKKLDDFIALCLFWGGGGTGGGRMLRGEGRGGWFVGAAALNFKLCQISDSPQSRTSDPMMFLIPFLFFCLHVCSRRGQNGNFHLFPVKYHLEERRERVGQNPRQKSGQNSILII